MTGDREDKLDKQRDLARLIVGVVVFGSIWGFMEATLGGFLHLIIFPNKGAIMAGIGMAIMGSALAIYKKPSMLLGIGFVAASFKLLDVWFFALSPTSIHIVNPAMAIILESVAFSVAAAFLMNKMAKNTIIGIGAGALAGLVSAVIWVYFAIYVMNAPAYARVVFTAGEYIANQGIVQAVFCGIFLPLGYLLGKRLASRTYPWLISRPRHYYATSAAIIGVSWAVSAVITMVGI
jgi:hypothetical protein